MPKHIKIPEAIIRVHEEGHKGLLLSEIAEIFIREIKRMSPQEKAELHKHSINTTDAAARTGRYEHGSRPQRRPLHLLKILGTRHTTATLLCSV